MNRESLYDLSLSVSIFISLYNPSEEITFSVMQLISEGAEPVHFYQRIITLSEPNLKDSETPRQWQHSLTNPIPSHRGVCGLRVEPVVALGISSSNPIVQT